MGQHETGRGEGGMRSRPSVNLIQSKEYNGNYCRVIIFTELSLMIF